MSRVKRGKGKQRSPVKNSRKEFEPDAQEVELFQTIKLLSEEVDKPDPTVYDPDEYYAFPVVSVDFLKKLEAHTNGLEPYPEVVVNQDLLNEDKHNDRQKVFVWGSKRNHYNKILKSKAKYKKDYVICPDAAWEMIKSSFQAITIWKKFFIEKNAFHQLSVDYETVCWQN